MTPIRKRRFQKYTKDLHALANKLAIAKKRRILQTGGFLAALLTPSAGTVLLLLLRRVQVDEARAKNGLGGAHAKNYLGGC